ncbi:hypothetical protein KR222_011026 [Zaprionus bogoriensis]|nr:hypothetical protein KR222_011026 [Zaprionus bogoriensis]
MKTKYKIHQKGLLIKCGIAFAFVLSLFLLHSLPSFAGVTLSWAAVLAALLLLILIDKSDVDSILNKVEWSTLIFFAALFVLMEATVAMGLIDFMGEMTINTILSVDESYRCAVSIIMVMWITAIASAFVDNIPAATMMLKLTIKLATTAKLNLSLSPLIWALSYGACFGGNGSLIAASANIVMAGVATQYGYNVKFNQFLFIGLPIMLATVSLATLYLLFAHCILKWHEVPVFER